MQHIGDFICKGFQYPHQCSNMSMLLLYYRTLLLILRDGLKLWGWLFFCLFV